MDNDAIEVVLSNWLFLVVGCGSIGKRHLGNLLRLGAKRLLAFDPREDRRREVTERFGIPTVDTLEAGLDSGPSVVLVCSPTRLHLAQSLAAAERGCHLFVEKPVSETLQGTEALVESVQKRGLTTMVGCNFRFHPGLQVVKAILDRREVGTVVSVRARFGQYLPDWRPLDDYRQGYSAREDLGGGVILDRIHEFDFLYWLFGGVARVAAVAGHRSHLEIGTEDVAEALLQFDSGVYGSVHVDYVRRTYDCGLEIIGDEGTLLWNYQDHEVRCYRAATRVWETQQWPKYDGNDMYLNQMRHFLAGLKGNPPPCSGVSEAVAVLRIALAVKQAARAGAWVNLAA